MQIIQYHNTRVLVGENFSNLAKHFPESASQVILLVDENVLAQAEYDFKDFTCISIRSGEASKSLTYVESLIQQLIHLGLDRSGFLVGVGGGVVCDITGFVATIFMRGVKFGFVPTTLLAQVDAAIGGKNGVNLGAYKNMIGTFSQPEFILTDLNFLKTLPQNEFISGMAEVVKHACISDLEYFEYLEKNVDKIINQDIETLTELVLRSVVIKTKIVEADERESGLRKLLNYGHTFGHAIEKKMEIPHGEAVSLGLLVVNEIAVLEQRLSSNEALRIKALLQQFGLPTNNQDLQLNTLQDLLFKDKKRAGQQLDLILLSELGSASVVSKSFDEIQTYINTLQ